MSVRVRFAPSPTGYLHLGVARTALFNWIFARSFKGGGENGGESGGKLILRIEDTDADRTRPEVVESILELTDWLGIDFDEGPIFQSERRGEHRAAVVKLLAEGKAYLCDEENNPVGGDELKDGMAVRFRVSASDAFSGDTNNSSDSLPSSNLSHSPNPLNPSNNSPNIPNSSTIHPTTPSSSTTHPTSNSSTTHPTTSNTYSPTPNTITFHDVVRGEVSFAKSDLEDFVIWRANGTPTFLLANAVDDSDMEITHAIRGEDLLSSTPKVLLLLEALGKPPPIYAHLPLLVNEQRKKLSKRRDDVSLADWRDRGYMPEAMTNYLALLGWGPPDNVEIRPMEEIIELFRLEDVGQSAAFFDVKKLDHFNATYIRELPLDAFVEKAISANEAELAGKEKRGEKWGQWQNFDLGVFKAVAEQLQSKIRLFSDIPHFVDWLFVGDFDMYISGMHVSEMATSNKKQGAGKEQTADEKQRAGETEKPQNDMGALKGEHRAILKKAVEVYGVTDWEKDAVHAATKKLAEDEGLSLSKAQMPIRVAITGRKVGLPLFESMVLLPKEEIVKRLEAGISYC